MARADVIAATINNNALQYNGGGVPYVVQKHGDSDRYYLFYVDSGSDLNVTVSSNGGFTWTSPTVILTGTIVAWSVFYDRWAGIASDIVHIVYTDGADSNIKYRSLDISTDTLGTQTVVFAGASSASGGALTVWRSRGTNTIRVAGSIDAGAEDGAWSSTDGGATWGDTIADPSEGATQDQYFGLPGWNADTNDEMIIFVDASANGLSVKRYDDSGNAWAETAIIADGSFVDFTANNGFPNVACAVDLANSRNIVVAWSQVDAANADLRCFIIDDTTITEVTNVVLNSTDDQGFCAIAIDIDTGDWYVFYGGKSDGTNTFPTNIAIYYKVSTDDGSTWGAETLLNFDTYGTFTLFTTPRFNTNYITAFHADRLNDYLFVSVNVPSGGGGLAAPVFGGLITR